MKWPSFTHAAAFSAHVQHPSNSHSDKSISWHQHQFFVISLHVSSLRRNGLLNFGLTSRSLITFLRSRWDCFDWFSIYLLSFNGWLSKVPQTNNNSEYRLTIFFRLNHRIRGRSFDRYYGFNIFRIHVRKWGNYSDVRLSLLPLLSPDDLLSASSWKFIKHYCSEWFSKLADSGYRFPTMIISEIGYMRFITNRLQILSQNWWQQYPKKWFEFYCTWTYLLVLPLRLMIGWLRIKLRNNWSELYTNWGSSIKWENHMHITHESYEQT